MMVGSSGTRIIRLAAFRRQCTSGEGGTRSGRTQARRVLSVSHGFVRTGPLCVIGILPTLARGSLSLFAMARREADHVHDRSAGVGDWPFGCLFCSCLGFGVC